MAPMCPENGIERAAGEQALAMFEAGAMQDLKKQLAAQALANTLNWTAAAKQSGVGVQQIKGWAMRDEGFAQMVNDLIKKRMRRLMVDGDDLVLRLQKLAEDAESKGKHKEAISALRIVAEMTGLLGTKLVSASQTNNTFNFGQRPADRPGDAIDAEAIEVEPE